MSTAQIEELPVIEGEVLFPLTESERDYLTKLEVVIHERVVRFVETGHALLEIRDAELHREVGTFEVYCEQRWGFTRATAYHLMDAAKVVAACQQTVDTPPNEAVARELAPILHNDGDQAVAEAWTRVVERLGGSGRITAPGTKAILLDEGYIANTRANNSKPNTTILLGAVGDKILALRKQLRRYVEKDLAGKPLGERAKDKAAKYAQWCDGLRVGLNELAAGRDLPHGKELEELLEGGSNE